MSRSQKDKESLAEAGGLLSGLCPDDWVSSVGDIDFEDLYRQGYRLVLFDIDNTLVHHGTPADEQALQLFRRLKETGFSVCLISNNGEARVRPFAEAVGADWVAKAGKPSPRGYLEACRRAGCSPSRAVFVGDQIFTDIWGARNAHIYSILTNPISPREEVQIILKRRMEWIVLGLFRAGLRKKGVTDIPPMGFQEPGPPIPTGSISRRAEHRPPSGGDGPKNE